jgi:CO dehydrogenase/acetyl-CoA synthase alpha subunit
MASSQEKVGFENVEGADSDHAGNEVAPVTADEFGYSPAEQKRIMRHVDRRLVLTVGAMYCVSLMDRTNLSAAMIAGMQDDLGLKIGDRYVGSPFLSLFTHELALNGLPMWWFGLCADGHG